MYYDCKGTFLRLQGNSRRAKVMLKRATNNLTSVICHLPDRHMQYFEAVFARYENLCEENGYRKGWRVVRNAKSAIGSQYTDGVYRAPRD